MRFFICPTSILILGLGLVGDGFAAPASDPEVRDIMAEIVESLQVVLPLSLEDSRFGNPENRAAIERALDRLARNSQRLEAHGSGGEAGFAFLSANLARDSQDIRTRFTEGRVAESRFLLRHLTDTCIACHSRLPDDRPHPLGRRLIEDPAIAALPPEERVQLEVATRQFELALSTYESIFADPATSLVEFDLTGNFESYLEVCLRVQEDPERAISHLEKLAARDDLPKRLVGQLKTWIESLQALQKADHGPPLERARSLIRTDAETLRQLHASELVPLIAASGVLQRYVASPSNSRRDQGEAYFLLGVIESRIGRTLWAWQTEHLLETAIHLGPTEPYADEAFDLLEEFLVSGYSGSSGTHVPADVRQRLDDLHALMTREHRAMGR
jgi:tetratricopeptide (TPR) repeat protein